MATAGVHFNQHTELDKVTLPHPAYSYYVLMRFLISFQRLFKRRKSVDSKCVEEHPRYSHLLFADDSVLFVGANKEECQTHSAIISCYEAASGQLINKDKSEVVFSRHVREG